MESSAPKEHRQFIHNNRKKAEFVAQVQAVHKDGGSWWKFSTDDFNFLSGKGSELIS